MQIRPTEATLGAWIADVDLRALDDASWKEIEQAFHRFGVLVFRGQHLDDAAQIDFSKRFGTLERLIVDNAPNPEVGVLSNVDRSGKLIAPGGSYALFLLGNTFWHSDSSYKAVSAKASLLSARTVPSRGGETEFADMRAAWDALDAAARDRLRDLVAVHSYWYSQSLIGGTDVLSEAEWAALPPAPQPLSRVHPETGRRSLFIGRHASHIEGTDEAEGRALLEQLLEDACQPPRVHRHAWQAGDVVIWDNRCVLHRGRTWPDDEPRVMHRTTVAGEGANAWQL